jgi:hypothetical protein
MGVLQVLLGGRPPERAPRSGDATPWARLNAVEASRMPREVRIHYERRRADDDVDELDEYGDAPNPGPPVAAGEYVPGRRVVATGYGDGH